MGLRNLINMDQHLIKKSKYLSLLLRHKPENAGLTLDSNGWCLVQDLVNQANFSLHELNEIVENDNKKRYEITDDLTKIRAVQGHSKGIATTIVLDKLIPKDMLYHGTKEIFLKDIMEKGLLPMGRNHVHLSDNKKAAKEVADRRKGKSVILRIDIFSMTADDINFFQAENGVWLCYEVLPKYIKIEKE